MSQARLGKGEEERGEKDPRHRSWERQAGGATERHHRMGLESPGKEKGSGSTAGKKGDGDGGEKEED